MAGKETVCCEALARLRGVFLSMTERESVCESERERERERKAKCEDE
jgi:hypothetical protein